MQLYHDDYLVGVRLFNRGDWFESHDAWEELWHNTAGGDRDFYQGLIQVAVGLCHLYNGNDEGARRMYSRATGYLQRFLPHHQGLDLDQFLVTLERCFAPVLEDDASERRPWDDALVPVIELDPAPTRWPEIPTTFDEGSPA
ncbi:hypothetical protein Pan216_13800 [Planctomycetes bacterium Pan216]|uniref:DUF309 domain-containing protein n=1 Tax=Kolteria novifilia TaxID=2527975 RepID=A0A518B0M8_9BACT|nr:hypothetical protein Pan216_13800 [Planctomycetes bacterium Pan216]